MEIQKHDFREINSWQELFDIWFEECSIEDVHHAIRELEKYGWIK